MPNENIIAQVKNIGDLGKGNKRFENNRFTTPASNTWGNTGRNEFTGPGTFGLNTRLAKTFTFTERVRMDFSAEAFNFTNTPQFSNPSIDHQFHLRADHQHTRVGNRRERRGGRPVDSVG